jgi:hypothetical protein
MSGSTNEKEKIDANDDKIKEASEENPYRVHHYR